MYWPYIAGFIFLSFGGFVTYTLFPAAPPWMASELGYIEPIHRISSDIWYAMGVTNFSEIYSRLSPNPVAAVPSLHAAYPTLMALFVAHAFGVRRTLWLWIYPVSLWVGIVYLGEHYVVDALLGIAYAGLAYWGAVKLVNWKRAGGLERLADAKARAWGEALGRRIRSRLTRLQS